MNYVEVENQIGLVDWDVNTHKTLKITGTRLGAVCGINPWTTPFQAWCEITKSAKPPFEETIYTHAGKVIEPKIINWLKSQYGENRVLAPAEYFDSDMSRIFDFYPSQKIFGGMWDALLVDAKGNPKGVFEIKTTKRVEDWLDNPPLYYLAQAFLYAKLLGVKYAIMVLCVMEESDYDVPENKIVNSDNTYTFMYDITDSDNPIDINYMMNEAVKFWNDFIVKGISPVYDEKRDDEYLRILKTANVAVNDDLTLLLQSLADNEAELNRLRQDNSIDVLEKTIKGQKEQLKKLMMKSMSDTDKYAEVPGWKLTKADDSVSYDIEAFLADNPSMEQELSNYAKIKTGAYTLRATKKGEN